MIDWPLSLLCFIPLVMAIIAVCWADRVMCRTYGVSVTGVIAKQDIALDDSIAAESAEHVRQNRCLEKMYCAKPWKFGRFCPRVRTRAFGNEP